LPASNPPVKWPDSETASILFANVPQVFIRFTFVAVFSLVAGTPAAARPRDVS
jgi:hypothetical protein